MRKRLLLLVCILPATIITLAQDITRQNADSMLAALKKSNQDTIRIDILLNLAQFHIFKPGENQVDFDSALVYINEASALNKSIKSSTAQAYQLLTESYLLREKEEKDEAKKKVEKAISLLEPGTNKLYLGKAYYELSQYYNYFEQPQIAQKIVLVEQALHAFRQVGNLKLTATSLTMLGDLYCRKKSFPAAIKSLNEALVVYDSIKYDRLQEVYVLLGQSYRGIGDEIHGLSYFLKALKTAQKLYDSSMQVCQIDNSLGGIYSRMDNKEMAVKYWGDGLKIAKNHKDEYTILLLATNIAAVYNNLSQPDKALRTLESVSTSFLNTKDTWDQCLYVSAYFRTYLNFKQYTTALPYRDTLLKLLGDSLLDDQSRSSICRLLTTYYLETRKYAKARYYLNLNLKIAKNISFENGVVQGSRLWYKLDSIEGNYRPAFNHLHFFKTKMDSIFNINMIKQLQVLGVEYETEMKEDSIKLKDQNISILTQKNNFQRVTLTQERLVRNITIAGIIVALFIMALLYRQYRHKQKSSDIISQKNELLQHLVTEKEWLLKEIHHRVKNNFQTVMSLLGTQTAYLKNDVAIDAINNSQQRIQAMSLIHQRLYQSNNLSSVKISDYIYELVDSLNESFNTSNRIRFNLDIAPVELDLAHCIPLGLILNEAITNSFKYAFPDHKQGLIAIKLKKTSANNFLLTIQDNGIGLPADFNVNRSDSMGMNLMRGLSAEIGSQLTLSGKNGTRIDISFTIEPADAVVSGYEQEAAPYLS